MVRAAAKNHAYVAVVTDPDQYPAVLEQLRGRPNLARISPRNWRRPRLSERPLTIGPSPTISDRKRPPPATTRTDSRVELSLHLKRTAQLRYGENPHQEAALYVEPTAHPSTLAQAKILHGKELSYNNLLDLDAALELVREFADPAAVVIKHNNPCGCALGKTLAEAFDKAHAGDPVSAFGSVVGFNRPLDAATAELMTRPDRFIEAVIAPGYEPAAFEILSTRPKWAKSVRILELPRHVRPAPARLEYRSISGGLLVQDRDKAEFDRPLRRRIDESRMARRDAEITHPRPARRPEVRLARRQTREIERDCLCPRSRPGRGRGRADEPSRLGPSGLRKSGRR